MILAALLYRELKAASVYPALAILALCIVGYMLAPLLLASTQFSWLAYPSILLAIMVPTAFWYASSQLFEDRFQLRGYTLLLVGLTVGVGLMSLFLGSLHTFDPVDWLSLAVRLGWLGVAFYVAFRDWRSDLVTSRIQLRQWLFGIGGAYIIAILVTEIFLDGPAPSVLELLNVGFIFLLVSASLALLLTVDQNNPLALAPVVPNAGAQPSALAKRVLESMQEQRAYAREGMTLAALAQTLQCRPQQLREVINTELGHRNFNAFINLYRVQEIAERMAMPEYRDTPLLTLALDAGFRSLAPFNRSFREHYQVTPSAFRAALKNH